MNEQQKDDWQTGDNTKDKSQQHRETSNGWVPTFHLSSCHYYSFIAMVICTEYYEALSVSPGCDVTEVKRAYRRLAMQYHPDKNKDPSAADQFKTIAHAYETLSDPDKRAHYDRFGKSGASGNNDASHGASFEEFFAQAFGSFYRPQSMLVFGYL
jgi:preprotein translocase subunit Sec63